VWNPIHERVADSSFFEVRSSLSLPFHYIDRYSTSFYLSTFISQDGRIGLGRIRDVHVAVDGFKNKNKVRQSIPFFLSICYKRPARVNPDRLATGA
jgi:hypothetical protein